MAAHILPEFIEYKKNFVCLILELQEGKEISGKFLKCVSYFAKYMKAKFSKSQKINSWNIDQSIDSISGIIAFIRNISERDEIPPEERAEFLCELEKAIDMFMKAGAFRNQQNK